eukprot:TRINITY_DN26539_c0_g1_i1.p1 TRINITY_DN26539_c0_g1~~TRINITY_DN26539_c0_g1_i1.p1  ORF type:complete len:497 (-),score=116.00 TRINITY_DN26539_c0_g1_i1:169-1659(-)
MSAVEKQGAVGGQTAKDPANFFKGLHANSSHRGSVQASMPMQLDAVLAKRAKAAAEQKPARPPNVFVDAVYFRGSADAKQKPLLRHVIIKDLNKVAGQLKAEVPTNGIFEQKAPMGMYCLFDGMSGAGIAGPASAEFCARNYHTNLLKCLSELRPSTASTTAVEAAVVKSLELLDDELLSRNPEIADGCGAAVALLVGEYLFVALMGRCSATLCEVGEDRKRTPRSLGRGFGPLKRSLGDRSMKGSRAGGVGGALVSSSPDVQTVHLGSADRHPFLVLGASTLSVALGPAEVLEIAEGFPLQPRACCGELTARASDAAASAPCTAVQVNFLPDPAAAVAEVAPPAKKAKVSASAAGGATQSMRLRHILVKFHEGPKPADDPKAKWASRTRADAEKILRGAIAELRQDRKQWPKTPKDVAELISMSAKKFIQLARQFSDCETAQKGALACGDLGWVTQEARATMSESFREACDILHPGQWSDIVASHQGLHLVQRIA